MCVWLNRNILGRFYKVSVFPVEILCHLFDLVLIILFLDEFYNQKTLFFDISYVLCLLCNLKGYLFECVTSNIYRVNQMLNVRVRRGMVFIV